MWTLIIAWIPSETKQKKKNLCSNLATGSVLSQPFNYHCGLFSFVREGLTWAHKRSVPSVIVKRKLTILRKLWNLEKHLLQYTTCFIYFQKWTLITMLINRPRWSRFYQSNQHEAIEFFFLLFSYLFLFFQTLIQLKCIMSKSMKSQWFIIV